MTAKELIRLLEGMPDHKVVVCLTDEGFEDFQEVERVHNDAREKRVVLIREGHQITLE